MILNLKTIYQLSEGEKDMEKKRHIIIIGHPARAKQPLKIDNKEYKISFDGFKCESQNEDPFIWNDNFFYSFCHSNDSLSKGVRDLIENQNEEVYFVFVAKAEVQNSEENTKNKKSILEIDTIIKAKELFEWPGKGERNKDLLREKFNEKSDEEFDKVFNDSIITYHLPNIENGNLTEHNRKKLFTCIGDEEKSFLPMKKYEKKGPFVSYRLSECISEKIWELITAKGTNRYYVAKGSTPRIQNGMRTTFDNVSNKISDIIDEYNEPIKDECLSKLTGKQIKKFYEGFRAEEKKLQDCKS